MSEFTFTSEEKATICEEIQATFHFLLPGATFVVYTPEDDPYAPDEWRRISVEWYGDNIQYAFKLLSHCSEVLDRLTLRRAAAYMITRPEHCLDRVTLPSQRWIPEPSAMPLKLFAEEA